MFPEKVYLKFEDDGDGGDFLVAEINAEEFADGDECVQVGVYRRVGTALVRSKVIVEEY